MTTDDQLAVLKSERDQLLAKVAGMEALVRQVRDYPTGAQVSQTLKDLARELVPF